MVLEEVVSNATDFKNLTVANLTDAGVNASTRLNESGGFFFAALHAIPIVFVRLWSLLAAPFRHAEMLWIVFPLIFSLLVMEFYYDRHNDEELGWGAAVANSLILIFVAIDLIKTSFGNITPWAVLKAVALAFATDANLPLAPQTFLLIMFVGTMGLAVTLINYFHLLPRKMAFIFSSHPPINFLAFFAIAIVYSEHTNHPIPFDIPTLVAGIILFLIMLLIVFSMKRAFPTLLSSRQRTV